MDAAPHLARANFASDFRLTSSDYAAAQELLTAAVWSSKDSVSFTPTLWCCKSICQVQGSQELREKVIGLLSKSSHFLMPAALRAAEHVNETLATILKAKLLAHVFSLKGRLPLSDSTEVTLEGWHESFTVPLFTSLYAASQTRMAGSPGEAEMHAAINRIFRQAFWGDNLSETSLAATLEKIHAGETVLVGSGWDWHATYAIFSGDYFFYFNCGNHFITSGWSAYKIGTKKNVTMQWLRKLVARLHVEENNYLTQKNIEVELDAKLVYTHEMKIQKSGNCTYKNLKITLLSLLAIGHLTKKFTISLSSDLKMQHWQEATSISLPTYKSISAWIKDFISEDFLLDVQSTKHSKSAQVACQCLVELLQERMLKLYLADKITAEKFEGMSSAFQKAFPELGILKFSSLLLPRNTEITESDIEEFFKYVSSSKIASWEKKFISKLLALEIGERKRLVAHIDKHIDGPLRMNLVKILAPENFPLARSLANFKNDDDGLFAFKCAIENCIEMGDFEGAKKYYEALVTCKRPCNWLRLEIVRLLIEKGIPKLAIEFSTSFTGTSGFRYEAYGIILDYLLKNSMWTDLEAFIDSSLNVVVADELPYESIDFVKKALGALIQLKLVPKAQAFISRVNSNDNYFYFVCDYLHLLLENKYLHVALAYVPLPPEKLSSFGRLKYEGVIKLFCGNFLELKDVESAKRIAAYGSEPCRNSVDLGEQLFALMAEGELQEAVKLFARMGSLQKFILKHLCALLRAGGMEKQAVECEAFCTRLR